MLLTGRAGAVRGEEVLISKLVSGQRAGGQSETQLITIQATDASGANTSTIIKSLSGYFRLSFNGSLSNTAWLPVTATASRVARALSQLDTMRAVTVTLSTFNSTLKGLPTAGYQWLVSFEAALGDQPSITIESTYITTTKHSVTSAVTDGDNSLSLTGSKSSIAIKGEYPAMYRSAITGPDARTYELTNLIPGSTYSVKTLEADAHRQVQRV